MAIAKHECVLDVAYDKFFETILDFASYPSFASGVKGTQVLTQNAESMTVHLDLEMIKRIEYDIEVYRKMESEKGLARIWWHLKSGDLFKKNDGSWELRRLDEHKTQVLYSLDVEFNFSVPGFILKNLIKNSLPGAVESFYKETKRRLGS